MFVEIRGYVGKPRRVATWGALFAILLVAIWAAIQSRQTPYIVLTALLYLITINFSAPLAYGSATLVPVVTISGLLIWGFHTSVLILASTVAISFLVAPLWDPLWESAGHQRFTLTDRLVTGAAYLAALFVAAQLYQYYDGMAPLEDVALADFRSFAALSIGYGVTFLGAAVAYWTVKRRRWQEFPLLANVTSGLFSHPFSILGGIISVQNGLPAFVMYGLILVAVSIFAWLSWQRSQTISRRYWQFSILNAFGRVLHETMDLDTIVQRTFHQLGTLFKADRLTIALLSQPSSDRLQQWTQYSTLVPQPPAELAQVAMRTEEPSSMDELTLWVLEHRSVLNLHHRNLHFAGQHRVTLPDPRPVAWLGAPIAVGPQRIGVISLQSDSPGFRFDRWNQELLQAIAGQLASAIQNARLYSEAVRLFNLTDAALTHRLQQLQALLDTMNEGVLMLDRRAHIVLVNTMAADLLGQPRPPAGLGRMLSPKSALAIGFDRVGYETMIEELDSGRFASHAPTVFQLGPAAAERHIQRLDSPVSDAAGNLMGWLMLFRDITEEVKTNELRSDLTRTIVHDLRNPLTTLNSILELARQDLINSPASRSQLDQQFSAAARVCADTLDMVDSLMDLSRLETGQVVVQAEAMRLPSLLQRILDHLSPLMDSKQLAVSLHQPDKLPAIWGDQELLRRVLINLLDNSLKYTPTGGFINIGLRAEPDANDERDPGIRCTIDDSGPGVPVQFRHKAFERYTRLGNSPGNRTAGSGLGLFFCKLAIEAHGGQIWIEDSPGETGGSRFVLILPGIPNFR